MKYSYLEIKRLKDFLKDNDKEDISWELIERLLALLTNSLDIKYTNDYSVNSSARFVPSNKTIYVNYYRMLNYLERNLVNYKKRMSEKDYELSPIYFLAQCLIHEVEHGKQYLMGLRKIPFIDELLSNSYKYIYNFIMTSDINNESYIKYKENENFYLLERNAQVESMNKMVCASKGNDVQTITDIFENLYNLYLQCGYTSGTSGIIYETFQEIGLEDAYLDIYVESKLAEEDRAYYGLPIKKATRKLLLKK